MKIFSAYVNGFNKTTNRNDWSFIIFDNRGKVVIEESGSIDKAVAVTAEKKEVIGELSAAMRATLWAAQHNVKINLHYVSEPIKELATGNLPPNSKPAADYIRFMQKHKAVIAEYTRVGGYFGKNNNNLPWLCGKLLNIAFDYQKQLYLDLYWDNEDPDEHAAFLNAASKICHITGRIITLVEIGPELIGGCVDELNKHAETCMKKDRRCWDEYRAVLKSLLVLVNEK